jgi:neutral ceramidase
MATKPLFQAGAATANISPVTSQFLFGYPHVERWSTGVHDPLTSSAMVLDDGDLRLLFIANDIIYVPKDLVARARLRLEKSTGIPGARIMITATHTHSGPVVLNRGPGSYDTVVPDADPAYLKILEEGIVQAGEAACRAIRPAEIGLAVAKVAGIGTNRRDPQGPADPEIPVLVTRDARTHAYIGIMEVYAMHPTVLHEDSRLASGDFPAMGRLYLQQALGASIPVLHHMGASGNQSPRYCVRGQTFDEAVRLGTILGKAVEAALATIVYQPHVKLATSRTAIEYPLRDLPTVAAAAAKVQAVREKFARQQQDGTPRAIVRTTECDLFGAEACHALAQSKLTGRIDAALKGCMPAEIQLMCVGPWKFVGWQGEVFIEYALAVRHANANTFVCTCANGAMAGYIATEQAAAEGGYEASTSVFSTDSGKLLVATTQNLIDAARK